MRMLNVGTKEALARWKEQDAVLVGRSFGSGIATPVAAKHTPRLLILGTPFAYLYEGGNELPAHIAALVAAPLSLPQRYRDQAHRLPGIHPPREVR